MKLFQCSFLEGPCCAGEVRSQTASEEVQAPGVAAFQTTIVFLKCEDALLIVSQKSSSQ